MATPPIPSQSARTGAGPDGEPFRLFETLRWEGAYPLLARHLARLAGSAEVFGFPFDAGAAERELTALGAGLAPGRVYRVRLLLDAGGTRTLEPEEFDDAAPGPRRVALAPQATDSSDPFLYHKTTRRGLYRRAARLARREGLADLLFVNERGELTEGAISNLFIERSGTLLTSPVACGLLPGVYRQKLLDDEPRAREAVLRPGDLESADAVFLCNALRGLRRVTLAPGPVSHSVLASWDTNGS